MALLHHSDAEGLEEVGAANACGAVCQVGCCPICQDDVRFLRDEGSLN